MAEFIVVNRRSFSQCGQFSASSAEVAAMDAAAAWKIGGKTALLVVDTDDCTPFTVDLRPAIVGADRD